MPDWKEIVGHDFTPEDWTELQAEAERITSHGKPLPHPTSDTDAERFVSEAGLSEHDLSGMTPVRFNRRE